MFFNLIRLRLDGSVPVFFNALELAGFSQERIVDCEVGYNGEVLIQSAELTTIRLPDRSSVRNSARWKAVHRLPVGLPSCKRQQRKVPLRDYSAAEHKSDKGQRISADRISGRSQCSFYW